VKDTHKRWLIISKTHTLRTFPLASLFTFVVMHREKLAENLHFPLDPTQDKCPCCVVCFTVNLSWQRQTDAASARAPPKSLPFIFFPLSFSDHWKCWFCQLFATDKIISLSLFRSHHKFFSHFPRIFVLKCKFLVNFVVSVLISGQTGRRFCPVTEKKEKKKTHPQVAPHPHPV